MHRILLLVAFSAALAAAQTERPLLTCATVDCVSGWICKMKNSKPVCEPGKHVTCAGFECDVGHHCELLDRAPTCVADTTCALVDCRSGMICEMKNGKATCVKPKLTCNTVKCAGGHRCEITPEGTPKCIPDRPKITCANIRCAGQCRDTPTGAICGPRPQILPISVGPTEPNGPSSG